MILTSEMQMLKRYNTALICDLLIGFSDGLVVPFALVSGLTIAGFSINTILICGIILIIIAASMMGISGYLTEKEELQEVEDIINNRLNTDHPGKESTKARSLFSSIGIPDELIRDATEDFSKDKGEWNVFREQLHPNLVIPDTQKPVKAGLNIAFAYVAGALLPVSPFYFADNPINALYVSAVITLIFSFLLGYFKYRFNGLNPLAGAMKSILVTAAAGGGAILVAGLF